MDVCCRKWNGAWTCRLPKLEAGKPLGGQYQEHSGDVLVRSYVTKGYWRDLNGPRRMSEGEKCMLMTPRGNA